MKPRVINFYGGPGVGKSTMSALTYAELKLRGHNTELIPEYAKDATWERRGQKVFAAQDYIFAKQHFRLSRVAEEVDFAITDAPLLLSLAYIPSNFGMPSLNRLIKEAYDQYDNINLFILRSKGYETAGRNQTFEEARKLDSDILVELNKLFIDIHILMYGRDVPEKVIKIMQAKEWIK